MVFDEYTMELFRAGDPRIFRKVFSFLYPTIFLLSRDLLKDSVFAHDVVAETFYKLWKEKNKFIEPDHLVHFLRKTATNRCIDIRRKKASRKTTYLEDRHEDLAKLVDESATLAIIRIEVLDHLRLLITKLSPKCHKVIMLQYMYGYTVKEVADEMGIKCSTVYSLREIAFRQLRK